MCLACPSAAGRNPGLRVVLMSATADADLFASYFEAALGQPSGQLTIPGYTHPVTGAGEGAVCREGGSGVRVE